MPGLSFGRSKTVSSSVRTSNSSATPTNWSTSASTPTPHGVSSIRHRVRCPRSDSGSQTPLRYEDQRTRSEPAWNSPPPYLVIQTNPKMTKGRKPNVMVLNLSVPLLSCRRKSLFKAICYRHRVAWTLMVDTRRTRQYPVTCVH